MGSVIPPGLFAEDCVIPAKANAAIGTQFLYLLKGIEPSDYDIRGIVKVSGTCRTQCKFQSCGTDSGVRLRVVHSVTSLTI